LAKFWKSGALRFHVEHADIKALCRAEVAPCVAGETGRHQQSVCHLCGVLDKIADHGALALVELAVEVAVERLAVDGRIGGDDLQGGGIGRKREVPIGVERFGACALVPGIVEGGEASKLRGNCLLDLALDLHAPGVGFGQALAQHKADGALDVVARPARLGRFSYYVPCGGHTHARRPQNGAEISPNASILVREHHYLQAIVRHVASHCAIGGRLSGPSDFAAGRNQA
jgi:hypothetical protein